MRRFALISAFGGACLITLILGAAPWWSILVIFIPGAAIINNLVPEKL